MAGCGGVPAVIQAPRGLRGLVEQVTSWHTLQLHSQPRNTVGKRWPPPSSMQSRTWQHLSLLLGCSCSSGILLATRGLLQACCRADLSKCSSVPLGEHLFCPCRGLDFHLPEQPLTLEQAARLTGSEGFQAPGDTLLLLIALSSLSSHQHFSIQKPEHS